MLARRLLSAAEDAGLGRVIDPIGTVRVSGHEIRDTVAGVQRGGTTPSKSSIPSREESIGTVARASVQDCLDGAVDAAAVAGEAWAATAPRERGEVLRRSFEAIRRQREPLARLIAAENGKTLGDARGEIELRG